MTEEVRLARQAVSAIELAAILWILIFRLFFG